MYHKTISESFDLIGVEYFGVCSACDLKPFFQNGAARRLGIDGVSVIPCLFPYKPLNMPKTRNLALYSIYPDYHNLIGDKLNIVTDKLKATYPDYSFKAFVDTSPIDEIKAAAICGLGNIGMNNLLVNKHYGSMHIIGSIITDMDIESLIRTDLDGCINCGGCIKSCPNKAIGHNAFNADKCLSAITQRKGELTADEIDLIRKQGLVWGCDCCSIACPINVKAADLSEDIVPIVTDDNLKDLLATRAFAWRGEKVMKRNLDILRGDNHEVNR